MREIELKFLLDEAAEIRLRRSPALTRLAAGKPRTASLLSVYYDSPDRALKAAGIALRLRQNGRSWVQTVKVGQAVRGGLSSATETESQAPGGRIDLDRLPDPPVRAAVMSCLKGRALAPVCETAIRRTTQELTLVDGARIELAIDVGEIRAGDRSEPLREVELELISGRPAALFAVARELFTEGELEFSNMTKVERGYLLAEEGKIVDPIKPRKAHSVDLSPEMTVAQAATAVLRECCDQVSANVLAIMRGDDSEGPHQLRVGLRRLRSGLAIFRAELAGEALARIASEARWLGQEVGRQRDLDVLLEEIVRPQAEAQPEDAGLAALDAALEAAGAAERSRLRVTLRGELVNAFLLDLAAFVETEAWRRPGDPEQARALEAPVAEWASDALQKCWSRSAKRAGNIEALSIEERHELRKALKRLRYAAEFLRPLYPEETLAPFIGSLKQLQDLFGKLNDLAVTETVLTGPGAPGAGDPEAQRAVARLLDAHAREAEQAWESAQRDWTALAAAPRFWKQPAASLDESQ